MSETEKKVVLATPFELLRVCEGHELAFVTTEGEHVNIRLYTADELLESVHRAQGEDWPFERMTREQAERLVKALPCKGDSW